MYRFLTYVAPGVENDFHLEFISSGERVALAHCAKKSCSGRPQKL